MDLIGPSNKDMHVVHAYTKIGRCLHKACSMLADAVTVYADNDGKYKNLIVYESCHLHILHLYVSEYIRYLRFVFSTVF